MEYLTTEKYCRASGYVPLDKSLPIETRKLFPFYIDTRFRKYMYRYKGGEAIFKKLDPIFCAVCHEDLSQGGNSEFYGECIVFEDAYKYYACCYSCRPTPIYCYSDQKYGFETPVLLPDCFKDDVCYRSIYDEFIRPHKFKLANYIGNSMDLETYKSISDKMNGGYFSMGSHELGFDQNTGSLYTISDSGFNVLHQFKRKQILSMISDILKNQGVSSLKPIYNQLTLF